MRANKKRMILSALSLVMVFCLLAGGTMAWFTDTEKVNANFQAGVLDIEINPDPDYTTTEPMEFKNLRPMKIDNFEKELVAAGDVNNLEKNHQDPNNYPADNLPIYFRPVRIVNKGTLPTYISLTMGTRVLNPNDKEPVLYDEDDKLHIYKKGEKDCANTLEGALKLYLYRQDKEGQWVRVEGVNLNETTLEKDAAGKVVEDASYNPETVIKAGEEVTYILAGYLPENTGNEYQGQHYHGALTVRSQQVDQGPFTPAHPGSGSDESGTIEVTASVKLTNHAAGKDIAEVEVTLKLAKGTTHASSADFVDQMRAFVENYKGPNGERYTYTGIIPDNFKVDYDESTDTYTANFGDGVDKMIVGVTVK